MNRTQKQTYYKQRFSWKAKAGPGPKLITVENGEPTVVRLPAPGEVFKVTKDMTSSAPVFNAPRTPDRKVKAIVVTSLGQNFITVELIDEDQIAATTEDEEEALPEWPRKVDRLILEKTGKLEHRGEVTRTH